jgi:hypothetical protein
MPAKTVIPFFFNTTLWWHHENPGKQGPYDMEMTFDKNINDFFSLQIGASEMPFKTSITFFNNTNLVNYLSLLFT